MAKKETKKQIDGYMVALMDSCVEALNGDWDPSDEGLDGFEDMHDLMKRIAKYYKIDVSKAKEIPESY